MIFMNTDCVFKQLGIHAKYSGSRIFTILVKTVGSVLTELWRLTERWVESAGELSLFSAKSYAVQLKRCWQ